METNPNPSKFSNKPNILFMGTPLFALASLKALWNEGYPLVGVVTQADKPVGRGHTLTSPPCAVFAVDKGIKLFQPNSIKENQVIDELEELKTDLTVVAAYGQFLPQRVLDLAFIDTINVHASLLPKYRGAAPIQWALIHGESETGITIMGLSKKMDAGPIYSQQKIAIAEKETAGTLTDKLEILGSKLLLDTIPKIVKHQIQPLAQVESLATFAPTLKKEDGKIKWNEPAQELSRLVRGLNPWPTAYTTIDNKLLKIYDALALTDQTSQTPGTVYLISPQGIHVACKNSSLCLTVVQLEGKKRMSACDFARGYRLKEGKIFL